MKKHLIPTIETVIDGQCTLGIVSANPTEEEKAVSHLALADKCEEVFRDVSKISSKVMDCFILVFL